MSPLFHKDATSFHLLWSCSISLSSVLQFSINSQHIFCQNVPLKYFTILDAIVNATAFLLNFIFQPLIDNIKKLN